MNVLLIDNRDSFTFNLADACRLAGAEVDVVRNSIAAGDALNRAMLKRAILLLSPGPGRPEDAGCCIDLVGLAFRRVPVIGICLGHQAIVQQAGGLVSRASEACHGKCSPLHHGGKGIFEGLASPMSIGRYHSLCTPIIGLPGRFRVDAAIDGMAMAVNDPAAGQFGVQFHPESILTPRGDRLLANLLQVAESCRFLEENGARRLAS